MGEDEEFDVEVDEFVAIAARPLNWRPFVGLAFMGVSSLLSVVSDVAESFGSLVLGAENYEIEQGEFHRQAALEIERLTEGE